MTVAKNIDSDDLWLANNGKVDASTTTDMPTQVLCSLLPIQFVDDPQDVLVIGLASGITAGAVSLVPDVRQLEVVELEPADPARRRGTSTRGTTTCSTIRALAAGAERRPQPRPARRPSRATT